MGLNDAVTAERIHIGFFGVRNAGKSSLVNAVTGQELSVVSDVKGTTTDPVKKSMELLPLGPVVIVDTPGIDDEGELGGLRIKKARQAVDYCDIAVLVVDARKGLSADDRALIDEFDKKHTPYIIAYNKSDLAEIQPPEGENSICVSATAGKNIYELKEMLGRLAQETKEDKKIAADLLSPGDIAVLVVPIDSAAPKGRLILPQQQTIRDILDGGCSAVVCRDTEFSSTLKSLAVKPKIVITDSQAFGKISRETPEDIWLTSFSILFARYKGNLPALIEGAAKIDRLKDGDKILISEGCTHHRQCDDIGTVKLPAWLKNHTKKDLIFEFSSGGEFPDDLKKYALIVHCGACMLNEKEMVSRVSRAKEQNVPMTNYGITIAHIHGILRRSLQPFPSALALYDGAPAPRT